MTDKAPRIAGKPPARLVGPELIEVETLELVVRLGRDHGLDGLVIYDVMFQTLLERVIMAVGPEAAVRYLAKNAEIVQRAAQSRDPYGLNAMPSQGEA